MDVGVGAEVELVTAVRCFFLGGEVLDAGTYLAKSRTAVIPAVSC